jgi:hypothetical protein
MNELGPLLEISQNSHTRALLEAGRAERAPAEFGDRLRLSLGLGVAVGLAAGTLTASASASTAAAMVQGAASTGGAAASSLGLAVAKWVVIGALGGGILASSAELAFKPPAVVPRAANLAAQHAAARAAAAPHRARAPNSEPGELLAAPSSSAALLRPPKPPDSPSTAALPATESGQLGREVQTIDAARRALAAGNTALALSELDGYQRIASTGVLDREARVLRIETLFRAGDAARAQQLSAQYLHDFPNDAHAAHVRALQAASLP